MKSSPIARLFNLRGTATNAILLALVFLSCFAAAQSVWEQPALTGEPKSIQALAKDMPDTKGHDVTILLDEHRYDFDEQNRATETTHLVYRVNSANGVEGWGSAGTVWEPWHQQRPSVKARVIAPDGTVYNLDPKNLVDAPVNEDSDQTFGDDRRYHGPLPGVTIGAIVEDEIVITDTAPYFAKGISRREYFSRDVPVQRGRLTITAPASLPLHYVVHLLPNAVVKKQEVNGRQQITVETGALEPVENQFGNLPTDRPIFPHVDFATGASSWKDVNDSYLASIENAIHVADLKEMLPKVSTSASRDEIIRATVTKLHQQIRYTGVEFGESGLIPQSTSEIVKRKFGDCKEKATLLVAMLRAQGIKAHLALLTSGGSQDVEADMPGMGMFDHAIVVVPGSPDLWIDATAEYTPVGHLPGDDQGRAALIVREGTTELSRTPEVSSSANVSIERREFFLADFGPAKVIETTIPKGDLESALRRGYTGKLKEETRKELDDYMQTTYLSEKLTSFDLGQASDLLRPYEMRLQADKATRGDTDQESSVVGIPLSQIWNRLPKSLRTVQDEDGNAKKAEAGKELAKLRTEDFQLPEAFVHEWQYHLIPAAGFRPHGLPPNVVLPLGPATLSEEFKTLPDNSIEATLRFDTKKRRYTAEESRQLRTALLKLDDAPMLKLSFDDAATILIREGKPKEALAVSRDLVAKHPTEALRRAKLARALLGTGLGEAARVEARAAVKLDPKSVFAQRSLAWILQHDLIGRRLGRGFDRDGSIAAYRKAKELDPKDIGLRGDLAILLEYDAEGERYTSEASLKEAIQEYRELKAKDKDTHDYDENLAFSLLYASEFKQLQECLNEIGVNNATRRALFVAAIAGESGADVAIQRSAEVSSSDSERVAAFFLAGKMMMNDRKYPQASKLLEAGSAGQSNAPQIAGLVEALNKTKRAEDLPALADPSAQMMQDFMIDLFTGAPSARLLKNTSKISLDDGMTEKERNQELEKQSRSIRTMLRRAELPSRVLGDIALSNATYSNENMEGGLVRLTVLALGAKAQHFFTLKEDGKVKLLGLAGNSMAEMGREVLSLIQDGQLTAAKGLLDQIRDDVVKGGGEDELSGGVFPRLWTKGQAAEKNAMEYAAAAIMADSKEKSERAIPLLKRGADDPNFAAKKVFFEVALATEYQKEEKWQESKPYALSALKAEPQSEKAFFLVTSAYNGLKDWGAWETLGNQRLAMLPNDVVASRSLARLQEAQLKFDKAREILKPMIDSGRATTGDKNTYSWDSLFIGPKPEDLSIAQRALSDDKSNFNLMHTLACLFAVTGKYKEARDLLTQAMNTESLDEPNSSVWFAYGLLAEQYGETQAARAAFARVEKPKVESPNSSYSLAQLRLKAIDSIDKRVLTGN